jgi:hypothetical protein
MEGEDGVQFFSRLKVTTTLGSANYAEKLFKIIVD